MTESTTIRENLMNQEGYTPYCGNQLPTVQFGGCDNPRTIFKNGQFVCPKCGFRTSFPSEFIERYVKKWNLESSRSSISSMS